MHAHLVRLCPRLVQLILMRLFAFLPASVTSDPMFLLYFGTFAVFAAILFVAAFFRYVISLKKSSSQNLVRDLAAMTDKLAAAEKIGHFGSFTWDLKNPSGSFWSVEMYNLFGLVPRQKPPAPDIFVRAAYADDRRRAEEEWNRSLSRPGAFSFSFRNVAPSGQVRFLRIQGQRTGYLVQGVAQDLTKEMEIDRAKTEFVSLASHQLKTPLTSVKWLSESLLTSAREHLNPKELEYVENIHQASNTMIAIVNDLLNVSRIELETLAVTIEEFDICALAQSVIEEQRPNADKRHITIDSRCEKNLRHILGDTNLVRMVLQNLISNAIKYTPEGGRVECEITETGARRGTVFIRVSDTGIGIPKDAQEHIFKKLYRAPNAQQYVTDGTGLGLYVVKTVVEKVHGGITFESKEGKGTSFYVSLPLDWRSAAAVKN